MTVQELYDQLSDEELKEALTTLHKFDDVLYSHSEITGEPVGLISGYVQNKLYHQAATRWLKNQSK